MWDIKRDREGNGIPAVGYEKDAGAMTYGRLVHVCHEFCSRTPAAFGSGGGGGGRRGGGGGGTACPITTNFFDYT